MAGRGPPLARALPGIALASTRVALLALLGADRLSRIGGAPVTNGGPGACGRSAQHVDQR